MRVMGFGVDEEFWKALRQGQRDSIERALRFLRRESVSGSCLISMPTGSGKTGVISTIAHLANAQRVVVVSHRHAVREQLFDEISGDFFTRVAPRKRLLKKKVYHLTDAEIQNGIYVTTFQKLTTLSPAELDTFKANVDLLIVDEGHSEPSVAWSKVARGLNAKKIIVTATPYRNDLFAFDIDPESSHIHTFSEAVSERVLEAPVFETVRQDVLIHRVREILSAYPGTKCIVKCKDFAAIDLYFNLFSGAFRTLSVHDQYSGRTTDNNRTSVPVKLRTSEWEVIVHQHKLDEGVDVPQAKVLVLTYVVGSGRELVQAVGRVVRKHNNVPAQVLELDTRANQTMWENYREFDTYLTSAEKRHAFLRSLDTAGLLKNYLDGFPEVSYFESSFRKKFDIHSIAVKDSLKVPLASVCFIQKSDDFSMEAATDRLLWDGTRDGELVTVKTAEEGLHVVLSVCFKNSKFLTDHLFFEPSLEITILKELQHYVAIFDSRSRNFSHAAPLKLGSAVDVNALLALAARSNSTRTKETNAAAISTTSRRPEHTSMRGHDLETVGYTQGNAAYALTTAKVDNIDAIGERHSSYYLGVTSGRVSDQMNRNFSLTEFYEWIVDIDEVLQEPLDGRSTLLGSYAKPISRTPDHAPLSVIVDLSGYPNPITLEWAGRTTSVDNDFIYAHYADGFAIARRAVDLKFQVRYDATGHAIFSCDEHVTYRTAGAREGHNDIRGLFVDLLQESDIKLLYPDGTAYYNGKFYQVTLPSAQGFSLDASKLGNVMIALPELLAVGLDEKGTPDQDGDGFGQNSIFFLLDQLKAVCDPNATVSLHGPFFSSIPNLDVLLCTDMDTEPADFILSSPDRLVFVHVKCGNSPHQPESSAGALAVVGSQAIKNLEILTTTNRDLRPGNWQIMHKQWPTVNAAPALYERIRVTHRTRFQNATRDEQHRLNALTHIWDTLATRRASPAVRKEIWIVVGNAFSRGHFERQMRRGNDASSESLQAFQLIDSWQSTAANNDVALKIFVAP
jgi:superfamily II DNA or RNA helicase